MKKEMLKKVMVLGMIIFAMVFIMGQTGVYAEEDLDSNLGDDIIAEDDEDTEDDNTLNLEDDEDIVGDGNELILPEDDEEDEEEKENEENSSITLTTPVENTNVNSNVEELPYTGTVSDTIMIAAVVTLVAFGAFTLKKAIDYRNI